MTRTPSLTLAEAAREIGENPKNGTVRRAYDVLVACGEVTREGNAYRRALNEAEQ